MPSRQIRSRGRFKLASSQNKRGRVDSAGFCGEMRHFQASTEFDMGMYPPGQRPIMEEKDLIPIVPMGKVPPEMQGNVKHDNLKKGNRNIQAKRLSS